MGRTKLILPVRPAVFRWLRESAGYTIEEVAELIRMNPDELRKLEAQDDEIPLPLSSIKRLAKEYRRQVACFFLPDVPEDEKGIRLTYYRMTPEQVLKPVELEPGSEYAKAINLAYRRARYYQSLLKELMEIEDYSSSTATIATTEAIEVPEYSLDEDPENIGLKERMRLMMEEGIRRPNLMKGKKSVLKRLRTILAKRFMIYVFQFDLPLDMIRGFSITDKPYMIVINRNDTSTGKIFTLLHEYAHILTRSVSRNVVCSNMEAMNSTDTADNSRHIARNIEVWCNRFAASFLMDREDILREISRSKEGYNELLERLARKYKTSKLATAYRILNIDTDINVPLFIRLQTLQREIRTNLEKIRREAEEYVHKKMERGESYLFTWEDIPYTSVKLSERSDLKGLHDFIRKRLKKLKIDAETTLRAHKRVVVTRKMSKDYHVKEEEEIIITGSRVSEDIGRIIARIRIVNDEDKKKRARAQLIMEDDEKTIELDVIKKNDKREIHRPVRRSVIVERRTELGDEFISKLLEAYDNGMINVDELADYLDIKITKIESLRRIIETTQNSYDIITFFK